MNSGRLAPNWAEPPGTQPGYTAGPPRRWPIAILAAAMVVAGAATAVFLAGAEDDASALQPLPAASAAPEPQPVEAEAEAEDPVLLELPTARRARALTEKGEDALDRRRWSSARREFVRAIRLDPEHARAHRGLGIAAARMGRYNEARTAYTRYIELDPAAEDAPDVRRLLGM
jgi:Flp pilus assembly protein TadD